MNQDPRHVPHKLHSALEMAATLLDLPLTEAQREALALELTGPVRALIAEARADVGDDSPVRYAVAATEPVETRWVGGCLCRIGLDVDHDSPAAALAHKLRSSQPDVTATEVPDATTLHLVVRPQSIDCWRWWVHRMGVAINSVHTEGDTVTGTGQYEGVTVHLCGDGVPALLADKSAARLMGVIAGSDR
ncbi:hypothetical protein [Streptomyces chartreusis]|uniref:hypothetical protein n=1 Tax=Streptomyces chartreusis TaxID=1969 RepID=UPI0038186E5E